MLKNPKITSDYFREYRKKLGFTNQGSTEDFLSAKDIIPRVDFSYIDVLNKRLYEIVDKVNAVVSDEVKLTDADSFKKERIDNAFSIMRKSGILKKLNNQGRRPEQVYFNWMRGYVT